MTDEKFMRLVDKVRRAVQRRETLVLDFLSPPEDRVTLEECRAIAEKAGCDWLYNEYDHEARFFEGN